MTRKDFFECCAAGTCGCGAMLALASPSAQAAENNSEIDALNRKVDFMRAKFAKLVELIQKTVDEPSRVRLWEALGRDHGKDYRTLAERYKGDVPGFLAEIQKQWVAKAEYDPVAGTIRIVDKSPVCTCPFVDVKQTPPEFCNCTLGWQKEVYSVVMARPVEASVEESILRGGTRCIFRIRAA